MSLTRQQIFSKVFKLSIETVPFVFKNVNRTFALYWIPFMVFILFILNFFFGSLPFKILIASFFDKMFTIFIIPYWVYAFLRKESALPFWDFVTENVTPLVVNYLKTFFVVITSPLFGFIFLIKNFISVLKGNISIGRVLYLLQFLLLALPLLTISLNRSSLEGKSYLAFVSLVVLVTIIRKSLGLFLVTATSLFGDDNQRALQESQRLSKNFLFFILLYFFIVFPVGVSIVSALVKLILSIVIPGSAFGKSIKDSIGYIINFYLQGFVYIFMAQLYFVLKKTKS